MPGQLKVDEIVDTAGSGPVSAINGLKTDSLTNIAGTAGYPLMRLETAKAATGTSVEFTGIPSWAKKITLIFQGLGTSGTDNITVQLGDGAFVTTGYSSSSSSMDSGVGTGTFTNGFGIRTANASNNLQGLFVFTKLTGNTWIGAGSWGSPNLTATFLANGAIGLSGVLDRLRTTCSAGFDTGTINILIEGY